MRVPALRFPEFRDKKAWQENAISDLFNLKKKSEKVSDFDKEKVITVKLHANGIVKNERNGTLTGGANYFIRHAGQFVFSKIDLLNGAFGLIPEELDGFCTSSDVPAFFFKQEESALFFINWLKANYRKIKIERTGTSSTLKRISVDNFLSMPILLPTPQEQQKIADCLSSLDNVISLQIQKIDALQNYKKGLMQKLFPAEMKTVPEFRFSEFLNAPGWEERTIKSFGDVITGNTPSTSCPEYYSGEYLFVSPADISDLRFVRETKNTLSYLGFQQTRSIKANSILFVCIGSTIGKIAQNSYECATNQQINSIIPNSNFSAGFIYYILSYNSDKISELAGKQAVPMINKTLFSSVMVKTPALAEQQKIADCLSSLDELIAHETQKLTTLNTHKTGLMQQLFPSMDEVNA